MTTLTQGQRSTAILQIGEQLTVSAGAGSGSIVPIVNQSTRGTPVAFTGAQITFGPFDSGVATYELICDTGTMTFDKAQTLDDITKRLYNAVPKTGEASENHPTTIFLPRGAALTLTATAAFGILVALANGAEPGAVQYLSNNTVTIDAANVDRFYFLGCMVGTITYEQKASVSGGGPVTITGGPFFARIGDAVAFGFVVNGPIQLTAGAADVAELGLTLNGATGAFSGTL